MKYLIIVSLFLLIHCNNFAQNSTEAYLENVKVDFHQEDLISDDVIENNSILLIGETHGFQENYNIAFKMIAEYKRKTNFKYILAEMDWGSAQHLNTLLISQDTLALKALMNESKGSPAWCKERFDFFKKIMTLNQEQQQKIRYIGVDIPSGGIKLTLEIIRDIKAKYNENASFLDSAISNPRLNKALISYLKKLQNSMINIEYNSKDTFEYKFHINNLLNYEAAINTNTQHEWDVVRDSCMFENYKLLEKQYNLYDEKMIGIWGTTHVYQKASEEVNWFASSLKNQLDKQIYSYRIFYIQSECMLPASWLPGFLTVFKSKKKLYYNTKLQNDNSWATGKKDGLKEMSKTVSPKSTVFYDLTKEGSPYKEKPLLVLNSSTDWVTTQYFQTAIIVRNSLATEPLGLNMK